MMHSNFGNIDLDDLIDEDPEDDPPDTVRPAGSGIFDVEDRMDALFFSATWQLVATVKSTNGAGAVVIAKSTEAKKGHTPAFTKRWTRQVIRSNKKRLRVLGVDVEATYLRWGGSLEDLDDG